MRPLFAYYGGTILRAPAIVSQLPPHGVYVEPFCGSAAVFFCKGRPQVASSWEYREVLNDRDERIVNLFRVMQSPRTAGRLIRMLEHTPYSRAEYYRAIGIIEGTHGDPVLRAWATFTVIEQSFGRQLGCSGWSKTVGGANSRQPPQTWATKTKREQLRAVMKRLRSTYLTCTDAINVLADYDSERTCFFCDPPYPGFNQGHYRGYTQDDFARHVAAMDRCAGSVVLLCYENEAIPASWERNTLDVLMSANTRSPRSRKRQLILSIKRSAWAVDIAERKERQGAFPWGGGSQDGFGWFRALGRERSSVMFETKT